MSKLKDTTIEGNLHVSGNLSGWGNLFKLDYANSFTITNSKVTSYTYTNSTLNNLQIIIEGQSYQNNPIVSVDDKQIFFGNYLTNNERSVSSYTIILSPGQKLTVSGFNVNNFGGLVITAVPIVRI